MEWESSIEGSAGASHLTITPEGRETPSISSWSPGTSPTYATVLNLENNTPPIFRDTSSSPGSERSIPLSNLEDWTEFILRAEGEPSSRQSTTVERKETSGSSELNSTQDVEEILREYGQLLTMDLMFSQLVAMTLHCSSSTARAYQLTGRAEFHGARGQPRQSSFGERLELVKPGGCTIWLEIEKSMSMLAPIQILHGSMGIKAMSLSCSMISVVLRLSSLIYCYDSSTATHYEYLSREDSWNGAHVKFISQVTHLPIGGTLMCSIVPPCGADFINVTWFKVHYFQTLFQEEGTPMDCN